MNIVQFFQKRKLIFASFSVGITFFLAMMTPSSDPLSDILKEGNIHKPMSLFSDFITPEILSYSGPVSDSLSTCIQQSSFQNYFPLILADYNKDIVMTQSRAEVLQELNTVLGYAVRNNQLNWTFNQETGKYSFTTAPGDEALWYCYFQNETTFFKNFFLPESLHGVPKNVGMLDIILSSSPFGISTSEISREELFVPRYEALENGILLGFINFVSSLPELSNIHHDIFSIASQGGYSFSLSPDTVYSNSSMEILRNEQYPFFSITITASSEAMRKQATSSLTSFALHSENDSLQIPGLSESYSLRLQTTQDLPDGASFQFQLHPEYLTPFVFSSFEVSRSFLTDLKGPIVTITDTEVCPAYYAPVCGQLPFSMIPCLEGYACPTPIPEQKTYSNWCELSKSDAIFLHEGECELPSYTYPPDLLEYVMQKTNSSLCSSGLSSDELFYKAWTVSTCGDMVQLSPPAGLADAPSGYYTPKGEYFFCGGYMMEGIPENPACQNIPQCSAENILLCRN